MIDLLWGLAANALVSLLLFVIARKLAKGAKLVWIGISSLLLVIGLALYLLLASDSLVLVRLLPTTALLTGGDLTLPFSAALAGILSAYLQKWRAIVLPAALFLLGLFHVVHPLMGRPPETRLSRPAQGVVFQTSDASCSAASAATLLSAHDIPASETEMARLCLTREDGTSMRGVYRGLRFKTDATPYRVATFTGGSLADLRTATQNGPVLISVGLPRFSFHTVDPRYQRDWGWTPGVRHAVVVFGFLRDGRLDMGDPSVGREEWKTESMDVLWNGEGIYLTKR